MTLHPQLRWLRGAFLAATLLSPLSCATMGLHEPGRDDAPEVVDVVLDDTSLSVTPSQVGRGKIVLDLSNRGTLEHAVRVVGPGIDETTAEFLSPSEHRRQPIRLGPGSYRIFCPDGNHAERGVSAHLTVTESATYFRR